MTFLQWSTRSPIQVLPVELVSYVFELGTHGSSSTGRDSAFNVDSVKAPLVYTSVCKHWRKVALSTPSLWTSLCITVGSVEQFSLAGPEKEPQALNTAHLTSYLTLSRKYPVDILIDARDMEWDFYEPEIPSMTDGTNYTAPFSPGNMKIVLDILIPHLSRWRSVDILTDTWAPMYAALNQLNGALITYGAPKLESLTLMRCNDFISHSSHFEPRGMREPALFNFPEPVPNKDKVNGKTTDESSPMLPRLRKLILRGVHVDWDSFAGLLPPAPTNLSPCFSPFRESFSPYSASSRIAHALETIELSSHSLNVRPTLSQFQKIIATSTASLHKLVLSGSGIILPSERLEAAKGDDLTSINFINRFRAGSPSLMQQLISLPHLHELVLGYRSANTFDVPNFLAILDAPNVRVLTLEDTSHPGEVEDVDATRLLEYAAGPPQPPSPRNRAASTGILDGTGYYTSSSSPHAGRSSWSEGVESPNTSQHRQTSGSLSGLRMISPSFPLLDTLVLKGVKASPEAFRTFFMSVPELTTLEITGMTRPMDVFSALVPSSIPTTPSGFDSFRFSSSPPRRHSETISPRSPLSPTTPTLASTFSTNTIAPFSNNVANYMYPCPRLQTCIIRSSTFVASDLDFLVQHLVAARCKQALYAVEHDSPNRLSLRTLQPLERVDIHLDTEGHDVLDPTHAQISSAFAVSSAFNVLTALNSSRVLATSQKQNPKNKSMGSPEVETNYREDGTSSSSGGDSDSGDDTESEFDPTPDSGSDCDEILVGAWLIDEAGRATKVNSSGSA
ncbi:hypothetical protein VKT23_016021 [Stygiomarasmius scandens]|uniref:F-box domain-containing protein n=1 Tax=Marasmiellus scandens TaxID=2682957 RepID=A0ABR1J0P2_9AGAR